MEVLRSHLLNIRIPQPQDKIYKDECVFSFDTPESETGLYICMSYFLGFGRKYVERHCLKTGSSVYLHMKRTKKEVPRDEKEEKQKPTRLAIGLEGGFDPNEGKKYEYEEFNSIVILPDFIQISLPNVDLPDVVQLCIASILSVESATKLEEAEALGGTWDGEMRKVSKYAENLRQMSNGIRIPPRGWKCGLCDKTDNLWLNLTDGNIMCGRKFFDGTGGNNHAMQHYKETGFPLVVKLGTITPNGGDVYSYEEDDMVLDPHLSQHLAHFGINITQMEKTDKSMIELELDLNQRVGEWAVLQECDSHLVPVYGSGNTGLANLGNSCYLNSLMQVLYSIPDFQRRYYEEADHIFQTAPGDPVHDFNVQMAKLGHGLLSGDYSRAPQDPDVAKDGSQSQPGIRPSCFKALVGRGHPEFSTKRQQDAQEFFLHILNLLERHNLGEINPGECFRYDVEERVQCVESGKVRYTVRKDSLLPLPISLEDAINKDKLKSYEAEKERKEKQGERICHCQERRHLTLPSCADPAAGSSQQGNRESHSPEEAGSTVKPVSKADPPALVRPLIPVSACLKSFEGPELIDDFYSSALKRKSTAHKTTRLRTFPDYLMVQLKKFTIGDDWVPKKLDIAVDMPDILDLSHLRGRGLQPGEEELPEQSNSSSPPFEVDQAALTQLGEMGFPVEACKRALFQTLNAGGGVEAAMNWIMEHMNDPDFASPFVLPGGIQKAFVPNPEAVSIVMSMGFTSEQAAKALKSTDNNVERAIDWIFSHSEELEAPASATETTANPLPQAQCRDGSERYRLVGFISHMGTSTLVGHYVCHILKEGRWVIFNDNKVALSEHPPKQLAYLYLYQRL